MPRFVGGAYDGKELTRQQVQAVSRFAPVFRPSGNRTFFLLPPVEHAERILRGEGTVEGAEALPHVYERAVTTDGGFELRDVTHAGALEESLSREDMPFTPEEERQARAFGEAADRFNEQLRSAALTGDEDVMLVTH